jgi:hypothetical protein
MVRASLAKVVSVMKKFTSLVFAFISTALLFAGAARAADRFDTIASKNPELARGPVMDGPAIPCIIIEEN